MITYVNGKIINIGECVITPVYKVILSLSTKNPGTFVFCRAELFRVQITTGDTKDTLDFQMDN